MGTCSNVLLSVRWWLNSDNLNSGSFLHMQSSHPSGLSPRRGADVVAPTAVVAVASSPISWTKRGARGRERGRRGETLSFPTHYSVGPVVWLRTIGRGIGEDEYLSTRPRSLVLSFNKRL